MTRTALACILAALVLPAACGGGGQDMPPPAAPAPSAAPADTGAAAVAPTPPAPVTPAVTASAPPPPAAPPGPPGPGEWDKWSHDQKLAYMKTTVMPKMHDLFAGFDSAKYGDMKCGVCHGAGAADGSFKMPAADIPKLPADQKAFMALAKGPKAKIFEFMMKQVEPQMAGLLGEQPFDMKTMKGFGCFDCHTKK